MIDWSVIATNLIIWFSPILIGVAITYLTVLIRLGWANLKIKAPDLVANIEAGTKMAVGAVEQLRKSGAIKDDDFVTAKNEAINITKTYLVARGFDVDTIDFYINLISASVENQVGNQNPFFPGTDNKVVTTTTTTASNVTGSNVTVTALPVENKTSETPEGFEPIPVITPVVPVVSDVPVVVPVVTTTTTTATTDNNPETRTDGDGPVVTTDAVG